MVGKIAVTVRGTNGTVEPMSRWTRSLTAFPHNIRFIDRDADYVQGYMHQWFAMKDDWQRHRLTERFIYPMTPSYAAWQLLAPIGQGLVVFDFQRARLMTMQDHTEFGSVACRQLVWLDEQTREDYRELIGRRRISIVSTKGGVTVRSMPLLSFSEIDAACCDECRIFIDLSPWRILRFPVDAEGARDFRWTLEGLGFTLNDEEVEAWDEWIWQFGDDALRA